VEALKGNAVAGALFDLELIEWVLAQQLVSDMTIM